MAGKPINPERRGRLRYILDAHWSRGMSVEDILEEIIATGSIPVVDSSDCVYCDAAIWLTYKKVSDIPAGFLPGGFDHLNPRSGRPDHRASNLVIACNQCNASKGTSLLEDFLVLPEDRPLLAAIAGWSRIADYVEGMASAHKRATA